MKHYSVMLEEIIASLNIKSDGIYVDATLGYAGMSKEILKKLNTKGFLVAFDQDEEAVNYSKQVLENISSNFKIIATNFVHLKEELAKLNIYEIDGIIFDLGFSSPQIDDEERGFSFMKDAPLDMRMDKRSSLTAQDIVNTYKEEKLTEIFFAYGEEKMAKVISRGIGKYRSTKKISRTLELVEVIKASVGAKYFYQAHPERKIFQALRIEVNKELEVLEKVLPDAIKMLKKGGRISVITFHSLEDKIVKNTFKKYSEVPEELKGLPFVPEEYQPILKIINKKVITPTEEELKINSRSHSAKLRIAERI